MWCLVCLGRALVLGFCFLDVCARSKGPHRKNPQLTPYRTRSGFYPSQACYEHRQSVSPSPTISMIASSLHERLSATPPPVSLMLLQEKMQNAERKRKERLDKLVMREKAKVKRAT